MAAKIMFAFFSLAVFSLVHSTQIHEDLTIAVQAIANTTLRYLECCIDNVDRFLSVEQDHLKEEDPATYHDLKRAHVQLSEIHFHLCRVVEQSHQGIPETTKIDMPTARKLETQSRTLATRIEAIARNIEHLTHHLSDARYSQIVLANCELPEIFRQLTPLPTSSP